MQAPRLFKKPSRGVIQDQNSLGRWTLPRFAAVLARFRINASLFAAVTALFTLNASIDGNHRKRSDHAQQ